MRLHAVRSLVGVLFLASVLAGGCGTVDQLADPNPAFETLVVAYGDPGPSPVPCDDVLPALDGVAQDQEWESAEPIFVRMSGRNGSGGGDYFLEVRAIWTDEGRLGGTDRIYFLIRYPDNDQDISPDQLAYIFDPSRVQEPCDEPVEESGRSYCPSPTPEVIRVEQTALCDTVGIKNEHWTRLNPGGREDQVFVLLSQASGTEAATSLIELNRSVLRAAGPEIPAGGIPVDGAGAGTEVWAWRAGRTNLHPIPQFADWNGILGEDPIPPLAYSRFVQRSGFCEDLWASGGTLVSDAGLKPFQKNFGRILPGTGELRISELGDTLDTVPVLVTQCPPRGREPSEEELAAQNGGLPKDLALWRHSSESFGRCDSLACSRAGGKPPKWSVRLLPGEFDFLQGWALQVPYSPGRSPSGRDVRARGVYEASQEKGFPTWSLEIMRDLNTGQADDLAIDPGAPGEYRMVIGVLDASGRVGSGSTEIRLKFQAPTPRSGAVSRC